MLDSKVRYGGWALLSPVVDAAALEIRIAGPDDASALAATTRLGFESYREWAPVAWRPPPRSLEVRAIRERLRQASTWCAIAVEPGGALSSSATLPRKRSRSGSQVVNQTGVPCRSQSAAYL
jgi:hypothetical protein